MSKAALYLILILSSITTALAQPELDISFNGTGSVMTDFSGGTDAASAVLVQSDQKIVAVGSFGSAFFALARYNTNGLLDTTFGDNGRVITDFDPNGGSEGAAAAVLQPDGKIIAAGYVAIVNPGESYFAVARYNTDGSLDQTFGSGGKASAFIVQHYHRIRGVALGQDGKIVVAGEYFAANQTTQSLIVRFNANGSLDGTFGSGGRVTDIRGVVLADRNVPWSVAIQPDGKVVTGGSYSSSSGDDVTMVRYNVNGTYDTSFGSGGRLLIPSPGISERIYAIALQPDGRIVAAGESGQDFLLLRFNATGTPDATFDGDGRVTTPIVGDSKARSVSVRPSGKIFASGLSFTNGQGIVAAYYNTDGSLDTSFSQDGKFTMDIAGTFSARTSCMAIDGLRRIVLGGTASDNFAVVRLYTVEPTPVTVFGRTTTPEGQPIRGITVGLTNQAGETRWAITSNFGYYQFDNIPTGQTYTLFVRGSKRYTFETRTFGLSDAIDNLDLIGEPRPERQGVFIK